MNKKTPSILITLDSMKDPNTGFFYFGKALYESLTKHNKGRFDLNFYIKDTVGFFKDKPAKIYNFYKWHKHFFPYFNRFDMVHITDQFCRLNPARVNGKKVLTIHDLNVLHQPGLTFDYIQRNLHTLEQNIEKCDKVVAISNFVANDIRKVFPKQASKVTTIYNGADKLPEPTAGYVPKYVPNKPFIFTIGPLNEKKNFHVLPALLQNNDYELVISGILPVPDYTRMLLREAEKYNCANRVILTDIISDEDKIWYYKNCVAFVFPSLAEGFGLPVIEAMHFGKPVFLSAKTSLPEIGGKDAFYFDSFNAPSMQLVFDEGMKKYEEADREKIIMQRADEFCWNTTAQQYLDLYTEVLHTEN